MKKILNLAMLCALMSVISLNSCKKADPPTTPGSGTGPGTTTKSCYIKKLDKYGTPTTFMYTPQGLLDSMVTISSTGPIVKVKIRYDSKNQVIYAEKQELMRGWWTKVYIEYDNLGRPLKSRYVEMSKDSGYTIFNYKGQNKIMSTNSFRFQQGKRYALGELEYIYDNNDNILQTKAYSEAGELQSITDYTYDSSQNAYSTLPYVVKDMMPWLLGHQEFLEALSRNNITKKVYRDENNQPIDSVKYEYTYNGDNYPIYSAKPNFYTYTYDCK